MNKKSISLFAGAGGMDIGFKQAGYNVIAANEIDIAACETYQVNHPNSYLIKGDIRKNLDKLSEFNNLDVVFGGPPCQGFSVAGKMDPDDDRSKLIFSFADSIDILKPQAFVMENVKALGILSKFEKVRNELIKRFTQQGYRVTLQILNAKDFGVPQARERVFFIGTKKKFKKIDGSDFDKYKKSSPTLRQSISQLGRAGSSTNPNFCNAKITLATKPILRNSPYAGMLFNGQGRPLNPDGWSSTLAASMGGNRTPIIDENHLYDYEESWVENYHKYLVSGGIPHKNKEAPKRLRRLTIDEVAIIQSFPKDYRFSGSQSKIYNQIGNAVPCELARVVASVLREALNYKNE